jgi:hypothetical protein
MLIDAVLLILFADLSALPAPDPHKFMPNLRQSQPSSIEQTNRGKSAPDRPSVGPRRRSDAIPYGGKISLKAAV